MRLPRFLRDLFTPDPTTGHRVDTRVRTPDGSNRPVTLVLGDDGLVRWEYRDEGGER